MKDKLIEAVINNKDHLIYIDVNENNQYKGWVSDFNIKLKDGKNMKLNLSDEKDLFLLFVLASSWSKTGPWENAALFTTYLKVNNKSDRKLWLDDEFVNKEINDRAINAKEIVEYCEGIVPRKKVSFRKDYYSSVSIIAKHWNEIKEILELSSQNQEYMLFVNYISKIEGLGAGKNKMRIKIPLILRELRCQNVYENIPGELCCVPDERVKISSKELGIDLPNINSLKGLFKASKVIYDNFGDLYDIPLFAYEDLK